VCMDSTPNCKLVCGHEFCSVCVKEWYHKCGGPTCPMCRQSLYFKGMYKVTPQWDEEKYENQIQGVYSEMFDAICDEMDEFDFDFDEDDIVSPGELVLEGLIEMEKNLKKFLNCDEYWDPEALLEVVSDPFCEPSFHKDHYAYENPPQKIKGMFHKNGTLRTSPVRGSCPCGIRTRGRLDTLDTIVYLLNLCLI